MPTAGELLRDERLRRGLSVAEISERTRISSRYLEAIEGDRLDDLPGEFFHRAFIRQYANVLQLDLATTAKLLEAAGPQDAPDPLPALTAAYENAQTGTSVGRRLPTGLLVVLLIAAVLGSSGLYAWWQHVQSRRESSVAVRTDPPAERSSARRAQEPVPVSSPAAPTEAAEATDHASGQPAATSLDATPGQLTLSATEPVWISVASGGETVFSGTMQPGDTRSFSLADSGRLVVGNAGGLTGSFGNRSLGDIGPRGQVRIVDFSGGDFQVRPPRRNSEEE